MSTTDRNAETLNRRQTMLRSACRGSVRAALDADDVIEILANADGSIWIERAGIGLARDTDTITAEARERIIRLVASSIGEPCDRHAPIVSAELPGTGERFEGLLPPVSEAPCFAIRKAATTPFTLADCVEQGALAPAIADALRHHLQCRSNILIAGGTSSGKTTFTNALLADSLLAEDRIVILEDTRELRCSARNVLALRTHREAATLTDLVRATMRLRPDRIVVGEVRGPEALDLLKAWNTGHPGGITTLHANSAEAALTRLEQLAGEATNASPATLISEAIQIVVFMSRRDGRRQIEQAVRVIGLSGDGYAVAPIAAPKLTDQTQGDRHGAQF
ncbi:MAG: P-type conjugative transfer ATPase TrbB [Pseudomonadota bacterium]